MTPEVFAKLVGQIVAGCQVPMSMGVLGAAREPLVELRRELALGGWHTEVDAEEAILKWLQAEPEAEKLPTREEQIRALSTEAINKMLSYTEPWIVGPLADRISVEGIGHITFEELRAELARREGSEGK